MKVNLQNERVLVLGASGWFGRTFRSMLGPSNTVLSIASKARGPFEVWDSAVITKFRPTVVANFAFLTQHLFLTMDPNRFTRINATLTRQFLISAGLPTVKIVITVSSGAVETAPTSPYGVLKMAEEKDALGLMSAQRVVVIPRAYSVSGAQVQNPREYLFSDLICQAFAGNLKITAPHPVYRRYTAVDDLLKVATSLAVQGQSGVFESGGQLVEAGELATRIKKIVNPIASFERLPLNSELADAYASDNTSWKKVCLAVSHEPQRLDDQIRNTSEGLIDSLRKDLV